MRALPGPAWGCPYRSRPYVAWSEVWGISAAAWLWATTAMRASWSRCMAICSPRAWARSRSSCVQSAALKRRASSENAAMASRSRVLDCSSATASFDCSEADTIRTTASRESSISLRVMGQALLKKESACSRRKEKTEKEPNPRSDARVREEFFGVGQQLVGHGVGVHAEGAVGNGFADFLDAVGIDRKSTRLNSSHLVISYAVFCLKKKKYSSSCTLTSSSAASI